MSSGRRLLTVAGTSTALLSMSCLPMLENGLAVNMMLPSLIWSATSLMLSDCGRARSGGSPVKRYETTTMAEGLSRLGTRTTKTRRRMWRQVRAAVAAVDLTDCARPIEKLSQTAGRSQVADDATCAQ